MALNQYMRYGIYPKVGTELWCPVCGKYFKATNDTRYIKWGYYVCNLKCFFTKTDSPIEEPTVHPVEDVVDKSSEKKKPKVTQKNASELNKLHKSVNRVSNKAEKRVKSTSKSTEKSASMSQNKSKKCDKVELF